MSLMSELQRILDLKEPMSEAEKKFTKTWMLVNGKIEYVAAFDWEEQIILTFLPNGDPVKLYVDSLEVLLPETGIYILQVGKDITPIYLQKIPKRQWLKSYSPSFYKMSLLDNNNMNEIKGDKIIYLNLAKGRFTYYVDKNQDIWHSFYKIGYIKNSSTLVCTNKLFEQELKDWWKNG